MKRLIAFAFLSGWFGIAALTANGAEADSVKADSEEPSTAAANSAAANSAEGNSAEAPPEDPDHDELRALRDGALEAFKQRNIDKLLTYLHDDVVITFQNAEVCRGHAAIRDFHARMSEGDDRKVKNMRSAFSVDELATIYGDDTAVSTGGMKDDFELSSGMTFSLDSRWTATTVKDDGRWLLAGFHVSTNMFDNGVSALTLKWNTIKSGGIGLAIGLALGVLGMMFIGKSRSRAA